MLEHSRLLAGGRWSPQLFSGMMNKVNMNVTTSAVYKAHECSADPMMSPSTYNKPSVATAKNSAVTAGGKDKRTTILSFVSNYDDESMGY